METFIVTDTGCVELFFNIFTTGIQTFVLPWDQLLYPCHRNLPPGVGTTSASLSFWKCWCWPDRNLFKCKNRWKSLGARSGVLCVRRHILASCWKFSTPATNHLLAHDVRPIDLAQLTINFNRRYALCIQKLYNWSHFTRGGSWNRSVHLQPMQRSYWEHSGSFASACAMPGHYSITYTRSLRAT